MSANNPVHSPTARVGPVPVSASSEWARLLSQLTEAERLAAEARLAATRLDLPRVAGLCEAMQTLADRARAAALFLEMVEHKARGAA